MKKRAFIYIIVAGILWGTSGIFVNLMTQFGLSSMQMTAVRGIVSAISAIVYVLIHNKKLFKVGIKELLLFICSGAAVFGTASSYYAAIQASSVSTAVVLMYTAPVFVMAFSVAFLGEKLNAFKIISVIFMIAGCALVSGVVGGMKFSMRGILMGILSGIMYSTYNIFTKIEMRSKCNSLSATLYCFISMGAISAFGADMPTLAEITMQNPPVILSLMIGCGLFSCVFPYFLYTLALRDVPAGTASSLAVVEPMSATVFSVVIFKEAIGLSSVCGIVLILAAVFLLSRSDL